MEKRLGWHIGALASAVALLVGLASLEAHALGLGRISVQSALGEPLRAEIEIPQISADEASSLKASVASAEVFRAAGLEYSSSIAELQISIQKRADGRSYLRLTSARAVTEPFVDLILEANWSSGRLVRDYTMLFDPPNLRQSGSAGSAASVTAPVLPRPAPAVAPPAATVGNRPYDPTTAPAARAQPAKVTPAAPRAAGSSGQQLAVKPGDTAGKIAAQVKPTSVSLDQMLVALLRSNPDAFIGGNINRLKSGSVLGIPGADEAGAISGSDASAAIVAQARDFNDFRRKLAESVPATQTGGANRQAGGKVQAKVEDKAPVAATPDKLTLSKGAVQGKITPEDKIAKDRQAKEASDRVAELAKNIGDLNKLTGMSPAAGGPATASSTPQGTGIAVVKPGALSTALPAASSSLPAAAAASGIRPSSAVPAAVAPGAAPVIAAVATTAQPAANVASTMTAASAPAANASTPAAVVSQVVAVSSTPGSSAAVPGKKLAVAAPPPPKPSLMDELTENPFVLPGLAALLLLLGGYGLYRYRQRHNAAQVDSSFLESRLQPDSFFGASGGQRIDTNESSATGSSLAYSPSQLDAAGDVDPVAEADVYLAYGRDLQAEEILKEAMRTTPARVAIHAKLMEIYAKRRDAMAFEVVAMDAFKLTRGEGPDWAYIGEMGRELDPGNALYRRGGLPAALATSEPEQLPAGASTFSQNTLPQTLQPQYAPASTAVDVDLDLDFSIGDELVASTAARPVKPPDAGLAFKPVSAPSFDGLDLDFDTGAADLKPMRTTPAAPPAPLVSGRSFEDEAADDAPSANSLTFTNEPFAPARPPTTPAAAVMDHGMLEFDLGSLSLDLDGPTTASALPVATAAAPATEGPLETKFSLAEEFRALGDMDGARALAVEVLAQAEGSLKSKAQAFLNALS